MTSSMVPSSKNMRRLQSRKSHSWWWDSHISPKNSKWLAENLDEMDRNVKRMLKLIEEDGDSFAKNAEMYYQRRPELVSLVEDFYRMYRSLAERYDHVTGELRKNIPSDLQSQGSGVSDILSEVSSAWPSPGPDQKLPRRKSGTRAAGFEFFLGSGGSSSDLCQKEGDESSTLTDFESESDDSSVNNYSGLFGNSGEQTLTRKMIDLENELRETKEKLKMQLNENGDGLSRGSRHENFDDILSRNVKFEEELKAAKDRLQSSEEEIFRLNTELQRYRLSEVVDREFTSAVGDEILGPDSRIQLLEELRITKEKLRNSEKEIGSLQNQLNLANKENNSWKSKLNSEKKEVSKLQERIARLKTSLSDRDYEARELKTAVSDAEQKIFPEKARIKAEISKLQEERKSLDEQIREWESHCRALEDDIRILQVEKMETEKRLYYEIEELKADVADRDHRILNLDRTVKALGRQIDELHMKINALEAEVTSRDDRITEMDDHLQQLHMEHVELIARADKARKLADGLTSKAKELEEVVERQSHLILETAEEKREAIRQLCFSLEHYRDGYHMLRQAFSGHKRVPVLAA